MKKKKKSLFKQRGESESEISCVAWLSLGVERGNLASHILVMWGHKTDLC